ncbi:hypothetical protein H9S92_17745, partial [Lewinella lacunae]|nr:hypothetical protein [Neolewinella lacunae]
IDTDVYAADDSRGAFRYVQFVKIYDEVAPVIEANEPEECFGGTSVTCTADLTLTFTAVDECSDVDVTLQLDANYDVAQGFRPDNAAALGVGITLTNNGDGSYSIRATNVPVGEHAIRIRAADGCGNFDVEILEFCVTPDKAPTPICIQTLTVTLMPNGQGGGMAAIWATDFIASDVFDCFGNLIDKYSIYTEEEAGVAGFTPVAGRLGIDLDCEVVNQDVPVRVYAVADNGSADYCSVIVQVQAFQDGVCGEAGPNLTGTIATRTDRAMANVAVTLTGEGTADQMTMTDAAGIYYFTDLNMGIDYTVQPEYAVAVNVQDVKTSDIVKITKVILGAEDFDSPYDYLAADVDQNRNLNVLDLVGIQRVILGLDANYVTGESWGFVPADVDVSNPYAAAFPEVYNANDLTGSILDADFVAFAYGDVVGNGRSTASINAADAQLEAGQMHTMEIRGTALAGFQGTIELAAGLELVTASYAGEGAINLNRAGDGLVAV